MNSFLCYKIDINGNNDPVYMFNSDDQFSI